MPNATGFLFMKMLSTILQPQDASAFRRDFWGRKAAHIKGHREKFEFLFGWESLNQDTFNPPHPSLKVARDGKPVKVKDAFDFIRHAQNGATLILEDVDRLDPKLSRFMDEFADEIHEVSRLNMYLSYPNEKGYLLHYDTQDFFILQIARPLDFGSRTRPYPLSLSA